MKVFRRLIVSGVVLLLVVAALGLYVRQRTHQIPAWYHKFELDDQTREAAANSMDQKLIGTVSAAQRAHAAEVRAQHQNPAQPPATEPSDAITVALTEDEINAFFVTWDVRFHWKEKIRAVVQDPVLLIEDHELILAANVTGWDAVVSLHILPALEDGKLRLRLTEVTAGTLPLPQSTYSSYIKKLLSATEHKLPELRQEAEISPRGWANGAAVGAAMSELLIRSLQDKPAEPVLFVPDKIGGHDSRSLPMQVADVKVADKTLIVTLHPMNADQRQALLMHLRGEQTPANVTAVSAAQNSNLLKIVR